VDEQNANLCASAEQALAWARRYRKLGFAAIPIIPGTKEADFGKIRQSSATTCFGFCSLRKFRTTVPTDADFNRWFDSPANLAIVTNPRNPVVLDFDDVTSYQRWSAAHPDVANHTPTLRTSRGYHVYLRSERSVLESKIRFAGVHCGDCRAHRSWVVVPPSIHPDATPYRWLPGLAPWEMSVKTVSELREVGIDQFQRERFWWPAWIVIRLILFFPPSRFVGRLRLRAGRLPVLHRFLGPSQP